MRGGAYGVFCLFDHRSGVLTFLSYRDPNLLSTLDSFDQSASFLKELALSRDELTRSIIGAIGDMDAYQLPDARGYTSMLRYLAGDTDESRQRLRDELLDAGVDDFHAFGEILDRAREGSNVVLMGSEQGLDAAQQARQGWLEINRVL